MFQNTQVLIRNGGSRRVRCEGAACEVAGIRITVCWNLNMCRKYSCTRHPSAFHQQLECEFEVVSGPAFDQNNSKPSQSYSCDVYQLVPSSRLSHIPSRVARTNIVLVGPILLGEYSICGMSQTPAASNLVASGQSSRREWLAKQGCPNWQGFICKVGPGKTFLVYQLSAAAIE